MLEAADELFSERGFERTTVRDIGARAGVDPALIARYYGSKAELYLAALRRGGRPAPPAADRVDLEAVLTRLLTRGPSPTLWAVVRRHEDPDLQAAAMEVLQARVLDAVQRTAEVAGLELPRLRAELVTAALVGIVLSRTAGALGELTAADQAVVARLGAQLLGSVLGG
ncbi:TetR family transcriptional regulator [Modestobacter sp. I12A-02628]|uniref:TetR/AcrR family transcriptional regulator n=1 Tax=Goekera deserti TaxID=2497753 RepID=A0A7K3WE43_9ACTN|nr:TetR family transcriptional regulator [Goekera deserti]NDI46310.1 TetR family transcriptional regulator [Goekera deserti]NEL54758.1 TetR/AcrR family transcriptional regulator [Goekera deserti]